MKILTAADLKFTANVRAEENKPSKNGFGKISTLTARAPSDSRTLAGYEAKRITQEEAKDLLYAGVNVYASENFCEENLLAIHRGSTKLVLVYKCDNALFDDTKTKPVFIGKIEFHTKEYLRHGQWNSNLRRREAEIHALEKLGDIRMDERDVLRNVQNINFTDHANQRGWTPRHNALFGAFSLFVHPAHQPAEFAAQTMREILDSLAALAASYNFSFADCGAMPHNNTLRKIRFGKYNIYFANDKA